MYSQLCVKDAALLFTPWHRLYNAKKLLSIPTLCTCFLFRHTPMLAYEITARSIMPVTLGDHHWSRETKRAKSSRDPQSVLYNSARFELDTRADTICAGSNFRLLSTTGQLCDVSGFHSNFESVKDVPIATEATAF